MAAYNQFFITTQSDTPIPFLPSRATQFCAYFLRNLLPLMCVLLSSYFSATASGAEEANPTKPLTSDLQLPTISLLQKSETARFKDLSNPFSLKHLPIVRDSETVTVNGEKIAKNEDYRIDYHAGTVALLNDYPPDAIVNITYHALPFEIKKRYKRNLFRPKQPLTEQPPAESKFGSSARFRTATVHRNRAASPASHGNADVWSFSRQRTSVVSKPRIAD